jgi:hypothetical protein
MFGGTGSNRDVRPESTSHRQHREEKFGSAVILRVWARDRWRFLLAARIFGHTTSVYLCQQVGFVLLVRFSELLTETRISGCLIPFGSLFCVEKLRFLRGGA